MELLVCLGLPAMVFVAAAVALPFAIHGLLKRVAALERVARDLQARLSRLEDAGLAGDAVGAGGSAPSDAPAVSLTPAPPVVAAADTTAFVPPRAADATPGSRAEDASEMPGKAIARPATQHGGLGEPGETPPIRPLGSAVIDMASLEQLVGGKLYAWIGAVALFLAGAFLVKFGVDQGWITPAVRVALALFLGSGLIVAGEVLRRTAERPAAALSASGTAVLFAAFFAAESLYGLIGPTTGLLLVGLTALVGIALSLRQGMIVAVVALVGGFVVPAIMGVGLDGREGTVTVYALLLLGAILAAARLRGWAALAAMGLLAGYGYAALLLTVQDTAVGLACSNILALTACLAYLIAAPKLRFGDGGEAENLDATAEYGALLLALGLVGIATQIGGSQPMPWLTLGALGASALILGRSRAELWAMPWMAAAVTALTQLAWAQSAGASGVAPGAALAVVACFGLLYAVGGYAIMGSTRRPRQWAALSAAAAVTFFLVAYTGSLLFAMRGYSDPIHWGGVAVMLAGLEIAAVAAVTRRGDRMADQSAVVGVLTAAATAFLAIAVPLTMSRPWFAVAWALEAAAVTWAAYRSGYASLRLLAWPLGILVAADLLVPGTWARHDGSTLVFNRMLFVYGVSAAAFAVAAAYSHRLGDRRLSRALQAGAVALIFVLLGRQVHHAFTETRLAAMASATLVEWSTYGIVWLLFGLALGAVSGRWPGEGLEVEGRAVTALGLGAIALAALATANPILRHLWVGETRWLNWLLYAAALPSAIALLAARRMRGSEGWPRMVAIASGILSMFLLFLFVTYEVRQYFHGPYLDTGAMSTAEQYAYSLAWVLLGSCLLVVGARTGSTLLRWASLPIMLLTVMKVFLYDMSEIQDLYRVLSFLGLGLSLVALGLLYQRIVFRAAVR